MTALKPQILIAEDDPVSRSMLEILLSQEGFSCISAKNGREALKLYKLHRFQIVITDWLMPEMDGTDLCKAIRNEENEGYTFIILITARSTPEALIEGLEAGADDYIVKPLNPAELRVRLKGAQRILNLESSLQRSMAEVHELSIRDALTGAFNRGYLDQQLANEVLRADRYRHPLSLILCDLDHFKLINDTHGHQVGDEVLKHCVRNISSSIRNNIDWVARYGGEEFLIALPETDSAGCSIVAERMRERISKSLDIPDYPDIKVSASFGTVTLLPDSHPVRISAADLIQSADTCLYQAKQSGRNCVVTHKPSFTGTQEATP
jgi:diguanylate cyclase (GGDEF)-like protein